MEDIILIDGNSGATAAHLSSLMKQGGREGNVFVMGIRSPAHRQQIQDYIDKLAVTSILHESS